MPYPFSLVTTLPLPQNNDSHLYLTKVSAYFGRTIPPDVIIGCARSSCTLHQDTRPYQTGQRNTQDFTPDRVKIPSNSMKKVAFFVVPPRVRFSTLSTSTLSRLPYTLALYPCRYTPPGSKRIIFIFTAPRCGPTSGAAFSRMLDSVVAVVSRLAPAL